MLVCGLAVSLSIINLMNRVAYVMDIVVRGFFLYVVGYLVTRRWWWALLVSVGINAVYELTIGRKYWRQLKAAPRRPRRKIKDVLKVWWQRAFSRERTKGYVWAGIILLLMSWVVNLNIYYVVVAGIIFTLAAISRFAPPPKSATIACEPKPDPHRSETVSPPIAPK